MGILFIFSIIAFCLTLIDIFFYWRGVFRKEIIPHPFTFFIWIVVMGISFIELIQRGEFYGALAISAYLLSCVGATFVGWKSWHIIDSNWLDWFFLISGIGLIIFWQLEPNYAFVLGVMIAIDACAYANSFKKAWLQPFTEKALPYFISVVGYMFTILSISLWSFENLGMWIWSAGMNFIFACFILSRQYSKKK